MQNQSLEAKTPTKTGTISLIVAVGASYQANDTLTLLAGFNHAKNPIPDSYLNPTVPCNSRESPPRPGSAGRQAIAAG